MGRVGRVIKIMNFVVYNFVGCIDRIFVEFESFFFEVMKVEGIWFVL